MMFGELKGAQPAVTYCTHSVTSLTMFGEPSVQLSAAVAGDGTPARSSSAAPPEVSAFFKSVPSFPCTRERA